MSARHLRLFFRYSRWLLWLAWLGFCLEFAINREQHIGPLGQLVLTTEVWMFGIPVAAVTIGLFDLMMRDMAGMIKSALSVEGPTALLATEALRDGQCLIWMSPQQ